MVGGKVIGLTRGVGNTLLHVQDKNGDLCAARVVEKSIKGGQLVTIRLGDDVWWQCGEVMWTPAGVKASGEGCGTKWDIALPKVGYSHAMGHSIKGLS